MKVYDCFTFYNEFELLELRLKSLWDVVDYFVLVEADKTQTNIPKPFYFNERKAEFAQFLPKIRHLMGRVDLPYKGTGDWVIEFAQRNLIAQGLQDAEPDDLVFISDLDEIWAPDILQRLQENRVEVLMLYSPIPPVPRVNGAKIIIPCRPLTHVLNILESSPIVMDQQRHDYYFDWTSKTTWQGSILTRFKRLTTPQELRNLRTFLPRITGGGRHFSNMGGIDRVISKMTAIVEGNEFVEKSSENLTDRERVGKILRSGTDLYANSSEPNLIPCDISTINLPYLQEFVKKYPQFLRPKD